MRVFSFRKKSGFTLVEMIVSLAVFSIVAVVALGALTKIVSANRKAQTLLASVTNLNFALETMSRELRVSPVYYCDTNPTYSGTSLSVTQDCSSPITDANSAIIVFNSTKTSHAGGDCNLMYAYRFYDPESDGIYDIQKAQQPDCSSSLGAFTSIIDPNVVVNGYYLDVTRLGINGLVDDVFPLVTVRISGYAGVKEREKTFFDVQTSVSPRVQN